jgi:Xaa-Pro aminopeptidase
VKSDLDRLMADRNLDALLVVGDASGNPIMNYLSGGAPLERAYIVKRRGGPLTLIHGSMERDTAAATGMVLVDRDQIYNTYEILKQHNGDRLAAEVTTLRKMVEDQQLRGRLGIFGRIDAGAAYAIFNHLQDALIETELVGEHGDTLFALARETKDDREIAELREAGRRTCILVGEVQEYIQGHRVRHEVVMRPDDRPLTIGDVKTFIRERLMVYNMKEDHENIFSQGRDAGVPHNRGDHTMPLRLGQSIIFDFFPQVESGYFHDITRTWSLGYVTDEVQQAWDETKQIFDQVMGSLAIGRPCRDYQAMVCDFFEARGHHTARSHPGTLEGYVHGLGHGVGLDIHEEPRLSHHAGNNTLLQPGHVVSVEPGLYYPERGFGVRVEDTIAFTEAGEFVDLTDYPYDLLVPMRG